jgi:hypothetical protein
MNTLSDTDDRRLHLFERHEVDVQVAGRVIGSSVTK